MSLMILNGFKELLHYGKATYKGFGLPEFEKSYKWLGFLTSL